MEEKIKELQEQFTNEEMRTILNDLERIYLESDEAEMKADRVEKTNLLRALRALLT